MITESTDTTIGQLVTKVLDEEYDERVEPMVIESISDFIADRTEDIIRNYLHLSLNNCCKCGKDYHVSNIGDHQTCAADIAGDIRYEESRDE